MGHFVTGSRGWEIPNIFYLLPVQKGGDVLEGHLFASW